MQKNCLHVQFITPKKYILDGLWYGGVKPRRAIVFIHGLGSSAFAHHDYLAPLADRKTAVIFFNNRGHDQVSRIKRVGSRAARKQRSLVAGAAHEVFADCADDIQGVVNVLRRKGVKELYLVGHSTGCQKSVYYLGANRGRKNVRGAVLLCPVSDYAGIRKSAGPKRLQRAEAAARRLRRKRKSHAYVPPEIWPDLVDAQRFLSLYTPNGTEELFTYAQPRKVPKILRRIRIPLHVVLAENDEYHDRDTREIGAWFSANMRAKRGSVSVIPKAGHGFKGLEHKVVNEVRVWLRGLR
jgi:pimeloyl-ACP methyl ester carboxylesterase